MGNPNFSSRKKATVISPSGVAFGLMSTIGEHQSLLTNSDEKKRRYAIDNMLKDCIEYIGDKTNVTMQDIENLLSFDRSDILFQLRQLSNKRSPNFIFDYEFPVDSNGVKRKQRYRVVFDKKSFPRRPAFWVFEKMVCDYKAANNLTRDLTDIEIDELLEKTEEFPQMYNSYAEMLSQHKVQKVHLEDCGADVYWQMLDVTYEKEYATNKGKQSSSSHDMLQQRKPGYRDADWSEGKPFVNLPLDKLSQDDIEDLRRDILRKEAAIETSVVVEYTGGAEKAQAQVNLILTPAFFFPSLAT